MLIISGLAAVLAVIGSLGTLVDAASLIFLITFGAVNLIGYQQKVKYRIFSLIGAIACAISIIISGYVQLQHQPVPVIIIVALILLALTGRPILVKNPND